MHEKEQCSNTCCRKDSAREQQSFQFNFISGESWGTFNISRKFIPSVCSIVAKCIFTIFGPNS